MREVEDLPFRSMDSLAELTALPDSVNASIDLNGKSKEDAIAAIIPWLEEQGIGREKIQ